MVLGRHCQTGEPQSMVKKSRRLPCIEKVSAWPVRDLWTRFWKWRSADDFHLITTRSSETDGQGSLVFSLSSLFWFWLTIESGLRKDVRVSVDTLQPPVLLSPSEMFLEQDMYKDNSLWIKFEGISFFSFFFTSYFCHIESILSKFLVLSLNFSSLQRETLSTLLDICLHILNNRLFLQPLNFLPLFFMPHHEN